MEFQPKQRAVLTLQYTHVTVRETGTITRVDGDVVWFSRDTARNFPLRLTGDVLKHLQPIKPA